MEEALLLARTVTRAQRMDAELRKRGITADLIRAPAGLSDRGCAYALRLPWRKVSAALEILKNSGQAPYQIFFRKGQDVREVLL